MTAFVAYRKECPPAMGHTSKYRKMLKQKLGLRENWKQFSLLVLINAFVGGMVGMERSILPQLAESEFGIGSKTAILSFIIAFGTSKAIANYFTGKLSNALGRKKLLIVGWIIALPVPFLLMHAQNWNTVVFANVLLGLSQGFAWSSTVVMKIDLVGEKQRGLAMGLNEFSGYLAVGLVALATGVVAEKFGVRPYPFYLGVGLSVLGLILSVFFVRDTRSHVQLESQKEKKAALRNVFIETTFKNPSLSSVTQAGLVNNLNDGMIWGLLPLFLFSLKFETEQIAIIAGIYPSVWGVGQLFTGKMSDHLSKKKMLFVGMFLQGVAILFIPMVDNFTTLCVLSGILGLGTAIVYPTFLTTIASVTSAEQRAESIGTFRLWRDLGYAIGALLSGIVADLFGLSSAIYLIAIITIASSLLLQFRMPEQIE